jgi:hypothetical protein
VAKSVCKLPTIATPWIGKHAHFCVHICVCLSVSLSVCVFVRLSVGVLGCGRTCSRGQPWSFCSVGTEALFTGLRKRFLDLYALWWGDCVI